MADAITARVEGLEEARRALSEILKAANAALPEVLDVVGQQAVTEIMRRAPLLTGRLRRSYTYEVDPGGNYVDVGSAVEYAPYQEFGTRYQAGTPHVRPAFDALMPQIPELVAEGIERAERGAAAGFGSGPVSRLGALSSRLFG